jgi:D-aminoacyl-tRNA deacylase
MRAVIQRVSGAGVSVDGRVVASIGPGLLVLLGVETGDTRDDAHWLAEKLVRMRIFPDGEGKMNRDICQAGGSVLLVSQFTLHASARKGNRPSFIRAARPEEAIPLYEAFREQVELLLGHPLQTGVFGAMMQVSLVNDGPVTIILDSRLRE